MNEEALLLGPYRSLVGVYTPADSNGPTGNSDFAAVLLNAGLIHHVGPHRFHVKLARALAAQGISTLRVDLSGIGDSCIRPDNTTAPQLAVQEPREILDELVQRGHQYFVLCGICTGAKHALQAASDDPRVRGLVLVNQASDNVELNTQASAHYYMHRSIWNPRAWLNLFTGKVRYRALFQALAGAARRRLSSENHQKTSLAEIVREELRPALIHGTRLLLLLSDREAQVAKLLGDGLKDLERSGQLQIDVHLNADHLFTSLQDQETLAEQICRWTVSLQHSQGPADLAVPPSGSQGG